MNQKIAAVLIVFLTFGNSIAYEQHEKNMESICDEKGKSYSSSLLIIGEHPSYSDSKQLGEVLFTTNILPADIHKIEKRIYEKKDNQNLKGWVIHFCKEKTRGR